MTEVLHFMSENPVLTFFILLILAAAVTESFKWLAYAIKGPAPKDTEDSEDE